MKKLAALAAGFVVAMSGHAAEPWDHDANIEKAVGDFERAYFAAGIPGVAEAVTGCYAEFEKAPEAQKLESCVAMDYAGFIFDVAAAKKEQGQNRETPVANFQTRFFLPQANEARTKGGFAKLGVAEADSRAMLDQIFSVTYKRMVARGTPSPRQPRR